MSLAMVPAYGVKQRQVLDSVRPTLFLSILVLSLITSLSQDAFLNWSVQGPIYGVVALALSAHLIWFLKGEDLYRHQSLLFFTFFLDSVFITSLVHITGVNQSFLVFFHLVNILLAGIVFKSFGAFLLGCITSIGFSLVTLFSPEVKALNFYFLLALNNIAFFSVAGLAGYLGEQFQSIGSELVKTGLNLKSAREFNQLLVENIPVGMIAYNSEGTIVQANRTAFEILEEPNLEGKKNNEVLPGIQEFSKEIQKGDLKFTSAIGNESKILGVNVKSFFSVELESQISIVLFEDLTKVRRLEYQSRQNEKMAAVGGLAAGIAHEIRNPLAGISGSIQLLSQNSNSDDDRKLMKIILREIDRLNNLITEFLDYSRPEVPPTDMVDISIILNEVLDTVAAARYSVHSVKQQRNISEGLKIFGRPDKLKQALLNIVINAYQALGDKSDGEVLVSCLESEQMVKISIRDNGCGMSEQTRKKMFEPFHTTKSKGTGLGLAVTHKILEGHGAEVFVESEIGSGTEFVLTFPKAN